MDPIAQKYTALLDQTTHGDHPVVFINGCTHGHEKIGEKVVQEIGKLSIEHGTIITNVANEQAFDQNIPFIESDLNRVFPGKEHGTYEERLAYHIAPIVHVADITIDIHSTETTSVGPNSAIIITKLDMPTLALIRTVNPPRVLLMHTTANNALISGARVGLGFEYGHDAEDATLRAIVHDIQKILVSLKMVAHELNTQQYGSHQENQTLFYEVGGVIKRPEGYVLDSTITNFSLVNQGSVIASKGSEKLLADHDFYPILFGNNRYTDIFGFAGRLIENPDSYIKT